MNNELAKVAQAVVAGSQRGFVRDRLLAKAVLELEGARLAHLADSADDASSHIDGSLGHEWMLEVLRRLRTRPCICPRLLALIISLYGHLTTTAARKNTAAHWNALGDLAGLPLEWDLVRNASWPIGTSESSQRYASLFSSLFVRG